MRIDDRLGRVDRGKAVYLGLNGYAVHIVHDDREERFAQLHSANVAVLIERGRRKNVAFQLDVIVNALAEGLFLYRLGLAACRPCVSLCLDELFAALALDLRCE